LEGTAPSLPPAGSGTTSVGAAPVSAALGSIKDAATLAAGPGPAPAPALAPAPAALSGAAPPDSSSRPEWVVASSDSFLESMQRATPQILEEKRRRAAARRVHYEIVEPSFLERPIFRRVVYGLVAAGVAVGAFEGWRAWSRSRRAAEAEASPTLLAGREPFEE